MTRSVVVRPGPCPRCGTPLPSVRLPRSVRQAALGGWTCRACGTELDRVGLPLDEYPSPGPNRYLTRTKRSAVWLLLGGVAELLLGVLLVLVVLGLPDSSTWWRWAAAIVLIGLGIPTILISAISIHTHHRRPWRHDAVDGST